MRRAPGGTQRLLYCCERVPFIIVPADIAEPGQKMVEGMLVIDPARSLYAVRHPFLQVRLTPVRQRDTDDRNRQVASFRHRVECREDHLVGEIAGHPEDHQRVRTGCGHAASPFSIGAETALKIASKSAAFRLAPPTSAPPTFGSARISLALAGLTDPP